MSKDLWYAKHLKVMAWMCLTWTWVLGTGFAFSGRLGELGVTIIGAVFGLWVAWTGSVLFDKNN